jgi:hypothetical protein
LPWSIWLRDGTLARGNLQERSFIPAIGMTREAFWDEVKTVTRAEDADEILVYMQLMLRKAADCKIDATRDQLRAHGRDAHLFEGLADGSWFYRINAFAAERRWELEHYIISSGVHEMIASCPIFERFKMVLASRYIYGEDGVAMGRASRSTTRQRRSTCSASTRASRIHGTMNASTYGCPRRNGQSRADLPGRR